MVDTIETLLLLLGIVSVLAVLAAKLQFPFPILLVIAGLLIGLAPGLPVIQLEPDVVFLVFLPPLLYIAAWKFPWDHFRANLIPIFGMAVGLVFFTIAAVGVTMHWLVPAMTLTTAFVLGAIISPPDAVAASAVLKNVRVPKRLSTILEGESLVNDASGLVAYHFAVLAVVTGTFSAGTAALDFLWLLIGGVFVGLFSGWVVVRVLKSLHEPVVGITLTILTPYVVYLLAEQIKCSGVLAVVSAGLFIGQRSWQTISSESRLQGDAVWMFIEYTLNGLVFILIGLQFPVFVKEIQQMPIWHVVMLGLLVTLIIAVARFIWMVPMVWVERKILRRSKQPQEVLSTGGLVVASWAGMRGVVSLATALALPYSTNAGDDFPYRNSIQLITFVVIFASLVIQGLSLPWVVRKLKVEETEHDYEAYLKARVSLWEHIAKLIEDEITEAKTDNDRRALEVWQKEFVDRLEHVRALSTIDANNTPNWGKLKSVLPKLSHAGRVKLNSLYLEGVISHDVRQSMLFDLDMEEERLKHVIATRMKATPHH